MNERKIGPVEAQLRALRERRYAERFGGAKVKAPTARKAAAERAVKTALAKKPRKSKKQGKR